MEFWDLYTENRKLTNKRHIRGEEIPDGCYHLVVHVWIRNRQGEYLISQRSATRPAFPLMWECVGGSVAAGESSLEGALREVKEEVGLDLLPDSGQLLFTRIRRSFHDFVDVWLFHYDGEVSLDNAATEEVTQTNWMTVPQIRTLLDSGKLVSSLSYFFTDVEPF